MSLRKNMTALGTITARGVRRRFLIPAGYVARAAAIPLFFSENVSAVEPASSQPSFAEMDKVSGVKGWNFGFPSFGDTLAQDYGECRSSLASAGIGLIEYNLTRFQANV